MRQHHKNCLFCKAPFVSKRSDALYCSGACKQLNCLERKGLTKPNLYVLTQENITLRKLLTLSYEIRELGQNTFSKELKTINTELNKEVVKYIK